MAATKAQSRRATTTRATKRPAVKAATKGRTYKPKKEPVAVSQQVEKLPGGRHVGFDLNSAIDEMPDQFIQCRDWAHSWRPHNVEWKQDQRCYEQSLRCSRCKTIRSRLVAIDGGMIRSAYDYPDGYLVKGMGRLDAADRNAIRLTSILRTLPAAVAV